MALVVEDGTGLANAESYASVAEYDQYITDFGLTDPGRTEAQKEADLRVATRDIDADYKLLFLGERRKGNNQALEFPRITYEYTLAYTSGLGVNAVPFDPDEVPLELKRATIELAVKVGEGTTVLPDVTTPGTIKRKKSKVGGLEEDITYSGGSPLKQFTLVERLLSSLIEESSKVQRG